GSRNNSGLWKCHFRSAFGPPQNLLPRGLLLLSACRGGKAKNLLFWFRDNPKSIVPSQPGEFPNREHSRLRKVADSKTRVYRDPKHCEKQGQQHKYHPTLWIIQGDKPSGNRCVGSSNQRPAVCRHLLQHLLQPWFLPNLFPKVFGKRPGFLHLKP